MSFGRTLLFATNAFCFVSPVRSTNTSDVSIFVRDEIFALQ